MKAEFEAGIVSLGTATIRRPKRRLKQAIRPDVDSTAAMVYLAATFAASGHDTEAAAAWQTALIEGSDVPQIYDWLAQSLVRSRRFQEARAILEEAIGKWPTDPRFTGPLATVYAGTGEATQAFGALERYLDGAARRSRRAAGRGGVDLSGARDRPVSARRGDDLKLAHAYADAYAEGGTARSARSCAQWIEFLDSAKDADAPGGSPGETPLAVAVVRCPERAGFFARVERRAAGFRARPSFACRAASSAYAAARARGRRGFARPSSSAVVSIGIGSSSGCSLSIDSRVCVSERSAG